MNQGMSKILFVLTTPAKAKPLTIRESEKMEINHRSYNKDIVNTY